ncbi:type VI secretion system baseplate subunit TssG [Vibrio mediterranei]|uniref:type VI secretion system baseplate subunit TssG n=1 Tax=Vibrio TaxID=662 RepID=UPI0018A70C0A|nr:type VI secretion system baseplate subunit TssG [Vibrio europaeus]MCG9578275.1 type VI secretion system baseplate subunit TssG [Vibrio tubiashii]MCG9626430.1 type VI secretion system baseplate subunit TssG [Vibrio mediterranei]MCG9583609.1 type VI secretion system baseplate subunit TssG [Vibrio tubiashii]MCG9617186.1 type VI secretion system baseplate subunit TssG [Vibrio tubiashii]MCG9685870.1 type VI secretion system baseplate subunit TssG [Vibrio tubiashii]
MQESIVSRLTSGGFAGQLEKAWQMFKHQAHLAGQRPEVRFKAEVLPAYYQTQVSQVTSDRAGTFIVSTSVAALSGNGGAMPRAMYSGALSARFERGDEAACDFFDTFNNRYYRLHCETEQKHDLAYQVEEEHFHWNQHRQSMTGMLSSLAGQTGEMRSIPEDHLVQYTGLLGLKLTCPLALKALLEDYFDAEFDIARSGLEYLPLTECSLTQIGQSGQNQQLGIGALAGKSTPMLGHKLAIKICPRNYAHYLAIRHDEKMIHAIDHMVRSYMGVNTKFALYMKVRSQYLPRVTLSSDHQKALRIGQSAWMDNQSTQPQFVEMPLAKS